MGATNWLYKSRAVGSKHCVGIWLFGKIVENGCGPLFAATESRATCPPGVKASWQPARFSKSCANVWSFKNPVNAGPAEKSPLASANVGRNTWPDEIP